MSSLTRGKAEHGPVVIVLCRLFVMLHGGSRRQKMGPQQVCDSFVAASALLVLSYVQRETHITPT
jgi:hypothetical protein